MFELPSQSGKKEFILTESYAREKFSKLKLGRLKAA